MNTTHLNTIGEKVIVKGGGSSGGGKSGMKYFDCLFGDNGDSGSHGEFYNAKWIDLNSGYTIIAPWAEAPADYPDGFYPTRVALAIDMNAKYYWDGQWRTNQDFFEYLNFDPSTHIEITEEEFYHIPEDKVFDVSTAEGRKEAYETLFPLVSRYYPDMGSVPTQPWFKSLTLSIGDDNGDRKIDAINYYGGSVLDFGMIQLEKKGNEYVLIAVAG